MKHFGGRADVCIRIYHEGIPAGLAAEVLVRAEEDRVGRSRIVPVIGCIVGIDQKSVAAAYTGNGTVGEFLYIFFYAG